MGAINRERLRELVSASGKSARRISLEAGLGATAVKDILSGKSRDPGGATVSAIANQLGAPLSEFYDEAAVALTATLGKPAKRHHSQESGASLSTVRGIWVVGAVQGGAFHAALEWPEEERFEIPVPTIPGYEHLRLRALKVNGPSVNILYPDGTFVIVADTADVEVRYGDKVVVYSSQGILREATIKVVEQAADGRIALWPRSTHPDFQEPIYIDPDDPEDQDRPVIAFVVVGSYRPESRAPAAIRMKPK